MGKSKDSLFEQLGSHEFMGGPGLGDIEGVLGMLAMHHDRAGDGNDCDCDVCKLRRKNESSVPKKDIGHILADANLKGIQANAEATSKYLFDSMREFHAENAELAKNNKKLKKQLRKQRKKHQDDMFRQKSEYQGILANFRKEISDLENRKDQMQDAIEGKERVLSHQAAEIDQLKESMDVQGKTIQGIVELTNDLNTKSDGDDGITADVAKLLESVCRILGASKESDSTPEKKI